MAASKEGISSEKAFRIFMSYHPFYESLVLGEKDVIEMLHMPQASANQKNSRAFVGPGVLVSRISRFLICSQLPVEFCRIQVRISYEIDHHINMTESLTLVLLSQPFLFSRR